MDGYVGYLKIIDKLNISKGDNLLVSSDITEMFTKAQKNGEQFVVNDFINSIIDALGGEEGTLVFPTYNWGFCRGETFDYNKTRCKTGVLGSTALKRSDFKRSYHPIYSFAVYGKYKNEICSLNNKSSFGQDSPFNYFYKKHFKNLIIDVDYSHCFTFLHFVEEQVGNLPYRYMKDFTSKYIDEYGKATIRTYSMYVRDLELNVMGDCNELGKELEERKISINHFINGINFKVVDLNSAYPVIKDDIVNNSSRKICSYTGQGKEYSND